jgi:hypothetical protein
MICRKNNLDSTFCSVITVDFYLQEINIKINKVQKLVIISTYEVTVSTKQQSSSASEITLHSEDLRSTVA